MNLHKLMKISADKKVIALVGGGGKTTSLFALSRESAAAGRRTVLMSTTHIKMPNDKDIDIHLEADIEKLQHTWSQKRIAAVGKVVEDGRMAGPDQETYTLISQRADAIYIEADGAKCLPFKYPDWFEPVIPENTDQVLLICGLSALDKPFDLFCHRAALARKRLGITTDVIDEKIMAQVLTAGYGKYQPTIILNQADTPLLRQRGEHLAELLLREGFKHVSVLSLHQLLEIGKREKNESC